MASRYHDVYGAWRANPEAFWADAAREIVCREMVGACELDPPLTVDAGVGPDDDVILRSSTPLEPGMAVVPQPAR